MVGSASNVTVALKATSQLPAPLALAPPPVGPAFAELCKVTSLTPSIRRRRSSVSATVAWLVVQPASVNVGTLPGGVTEATEDEAPALELVDAPDVPEEEPIVPDSEVNATFAGSTRPSSWKACAQSKREFDERLDGLEALFAHRRKARVGGERGGARLRPLRLGRERRDFALAA